ncbi:hypothetical protein BpHYR1_048363 [Brachionus plicatilis]|uniref:Uncharacterized protein n=1 Tax=Brachionus plicatilis TaxID=10195 RepID=A0A3M7QKL6_BRAPC|nr:hypothetical protein BpHYR1_048363 [Brachionus plicatilis]
MTMPVKYNWARSDLISWCYLSKSQNYAKFLSNFLGIIRLLMNQKKLQLQRNYSSINKFAHKALEKQ